MTLGYRGVLAILLLVFYIPCFLISIALIFRHGWRQSWWTWFVLSTFSLTRSAYAALILAASTHPEKHGLRVAAATLAVDGLSPLLLVSVGLVHRLRNFIAQDKRGFQSSMTLGVNFLRLLELLVTAAFICASIGYRGISNEEVEHGITKHSSILKAAAGMYVAAFAGTLAAAGELCARFRKFVPRGEGKVLLVLVTGLPLLCVRTIYLAVDVLADVEVFSAISGNVTIFLCMGLLPEALVSGGYVILGYLVRIVSNEEWIELRNHGKNREDEEA